MPTVTKPTTETLVELLSHLVRFPTVTSDQATNRAAVDWVEQQLDGLPLHVQRYESRGFPSLIATTRRTKNPKLWLAAHIDVVPGAPESYNPIVRDGKLYGRGTHDMKFALAAFIALLQDLGSSLSEYDLGLMVTADEEVGGADGVHYLLNHHGYRGQAAIIPDCNADWKFEMGAKGVMWVDLTATGQTGHASRTWQGLNAIDELYRFVNHVRANVHTEPCNDPLHQHATLNLGTISGGTAANAVAGSATARIDIRFTPKHTVEQVTAWLTEAQIAVPSVTAQVAIADPPYVVSDHGPLKRFEQITKEVTGHGVGKMLAHGSSDARHFARHHIPTINVASTGSGYHVPDEWIDIKDLSRFYEVTKRFAQDRSK